MSSIYIFLFTFSAYKVLFLYKARLVKNENIGGPEENALGFADYTDWDDEEWDLTWRRDEASKVLEQIKFQENVGTERERFSVS